MDQSLNGHIVLDLSRLIWRAARFAPTGIDRVELAYARHLIATARDRLSFTGWWGRLGLLPADDAIAMVAALDAMWSGSAVDRAAHGAAGAIAQKLRRHVLLRGEAPLYAHLACIGKPIVYLQVSHHRLHRPSGLERLKRRTGARFVFLVHDLIPIEYPEHVPLGHARRHHRRIDTVARLADRVIVNSSGTETALRRHLALSGAAVPIVVAPLGIDLRASGPAAESAERPYFICVATIEPRKNHILLLNIWRHLAATLGAAAPSLVFVGRRGAKSKQIVDVIRTSAALSELVEEHNRLPDAAVANLVSGARALLYPSFAEGYGLPVAEALALGVPVLCSDLAELREVGRDVPEYLDPRDEAAWCRAVLDYAQPRSPARQAQLDRLAAWETPSWNAHFTIVQPLIDAAGAPPDRRRCAYSVVAAATGAAASPEQIPAISARTVPAPHPPTLRAGPSLSPRRR